MHAKAYPKIREIVSELREFSLSKELRAMREMRWKARLDQMMWNDEYRMRGMEEGAAREREKWEAKFEAARSEIEAVRSENEALRRELKRLRGEWLDGAG
jgi:predicted  nucleic acid-binding Zn-ribbon protein